MKFNLVENRDKIVHFIGIGGVSMSGLAEILLTNGYKVTGSDANNSHLIEKLKTKGCEIFLGHTAKNVENADIIVYTAAISKDNEELIAAFNKGVPVFDRAVFLGQLMNNHKHSIAISGTHGKTTTTSMVSHIFMKGNYDPTISVGADLDLIKGNVYAGNSSYFITEACEYNRSFLNFDPFVGIILNIEADHLDYYKDINEIEEVFVTFSNKIPNDGFLVGNADDHRVSKVMNSAKCNVISFGIDNGDLRAKNIEFNARNCAKFDVYYKDEFFTNVELSVPGKHNLLNSLAAIGSAIALNVDKDVVSSGLVEYLGTHKRFEFKGEKNKVTVIDDYAHHPTEVKVALKTARSCNPSRIICAFQPHTYSRTLTLFEDFVTCFDEADEIILADIYAAREKDTGVISSMMLGDKIRERGLKCTNFHTFDEITEYVKSIVKEGDYLLTVGAGKIVEVGEAFLNSDN